MRQSFGPYRILKKLGEGGMGIVYAATDERLGRAVAIKTVRAEMAGANARERLRREARTAASISHPNICQLFEIGEEDGELYIAMELLEGEPLSDRLARGPLGVEQAVRVATDVLAALGALHRRGIVHRDLKPANIFLTEHGAKLLDFGIARAALEDAQRTLLSLTGEGNVIGTPRYMAPEQATGDPVDARSDLFAVGAMLYEMLAGRPAFEGDTAVRLLHAVLHDQPSAMTGSAAVLAVDRVVQRALAKQPAGRYESAEQFAGALRAASDGSASTGRVDAQSISRLIVLPFRLLRADAEVDFLAFSLADAVTSSLSGLGSLIVRSSLTAAKLGTDATDLAKIAREADVDVVLSGTLLRAGEKVRLTAELAEAPGGAILWSDVMQVSFDDIFQLHDTLVHKLVDALAVPLTARDHRLLGRDVPASAKAYEFYLRANELAKEPAGWDTAVGLYKQCLDLDAQYAPAWARLGRVYRLIAKYGPDHTDRSPARALEALNRALALNPDLAIAHHMLAQIEIDSGRAVDAMARLLRRAQHGAADPELYAALCHACRYCGLLDASIAAHQRAVNLDPKATTSVIHTWFQLRNFERVIEGNPDRVPYVAAVALTELGRTDEARTLVQTMWQRVPPRLRAFLEAALIVIEGRALGGVDAVPGALLSVIDQFEDPEGIYYAARQLARLGELGDAVRGIKRAVDGGYLCYPAFATDPWLDSLRGRADFESIMRRAKKGYETAVVVFKDADGERIVGVRIGDV